MTKPVVSEFVVAAVAVVVAVVVVVVVVEQVVPVGSTDHIRVEEMWFCWNHLRLHYCTGLAMFENECIGQMLVLKERSMQQYSLVR